MNKEETKVEKIQKLSKTAVTLTIVARIICLISAAIAMIFGIVILLFQPQICSQLADARERGVFEEMGFSLDEYIADESILFSSPQYFLKSITEGSSDDVTNACNAISGYCIACGVALIVLAFIIRCIGKIFKQFIDSDSPFRPEIVKKLRIPFVLITVLTVKTSLFLGLIIGLSLYCIYLIFEYGCELQKQSDETL